MTLKVYIKAWKMLELNERKSAMIAFTFVIISALFSAIMIGSVMPFLSVLSDPKKFIENNHFSQIINYMKIENIISMQYVAGVFTLIIIVMGNIIQMVRLYFITNFSTMLLHSFSTRLLKVYIQQSYEFFINKNSGDLGSKILAESEKLVQFFYRPASEALASFITVLAIIFFLCWVNLKVTIISILFISSFYLIIYYLSRRIVGIYGEVRAKANMCRFRIAQEVLIGIKEIKILGRENNYIESYIKPSFKMAKAESNAIFIGTLPIYFMQILAFGGIIIFILIYLKMSDSNTESFINEMLPLIGVFAFGGQRLIPELAKVYSGISQINYGKIVIDSIYQDLLLNNNIKRHSLKENSAITLNKSIELKNIQYKYPNTDKYVLKNISLKIKAGDKIGIVGGSGSGKTTFVDIMIGLLSSYEGQIIIDGVEIDETNLRLWQQSVGYVPQDVFLSDSSIIENIALGIPKELINTENALRAGELAQLDFINADDSSRTYEDIVGERGVRLSGGQRQRLGIARAFYNNVDLLVFDEATSALDNNTEKNIMRLIDNISKNKTVIIIAHRLTTIKNCDKIIVLEKGQLVGFDSLENLINNNYYFNKIYVDSNNN